MGTSIKFIVVALMSIGAGWACRPAETPNSGTGRDVLRIAMPPGRIDDFNRVVGQAFVEQTGISIEPIGLRSSEQVARIRIEAGRPTLDVLWIDLSEARVLANEQLLSPVDAETIPNLRFVRENALVGQNMAPITFSSALGFLVNTDRLDEPPTSWRELWHPRYHGELALFDFGSTLGPITLVMAARLNGGGESAIEPGWRALRSLAESAVVFRSSGPQNNLMVAQGEAGVTFGLASQTLDLQSKGAPVEWILPKEGAIALPQGFQIVAGTPSLEAARRFLDYTLSQSVQTRLAQELLLVATRRDIQLSEEVQALVPLEKILYFDLDVVGAKRGEWTDRFNREILTGQH